MCAMSAFIRAGRRHIRLIRLRMLFRRSAPDGKGIKVQLLRFRQTVRAAVPPCPFCQSASDFLSSACTAGTASRRGDPRTSSPPEYRASDRSLRVVNVSAGAFVSLLPASMRFLTVRPEICLRLPSDPASRRTPLVFGYTLPAAGWVRDFHPLDFAHAGRTSSDGAVTLTFQKRRNATALFYSNPPKSPHILTSMV